MKSVDFHNFGGPDALVLEEIQKPVPVKGQVLIKVIAAGINPFDWKLREGLFPDVPLPLIPGSEIAGIIEQIGEGVTDFKVGDEVIAILEIGQGGYAEFCVTESPHVVLKPKDIDFIHAASIPVAAMTAWQALFDHAQLAKGQKILIHGAAGGVGSFAVQLAKWKGAFVIATGSEVNKEFLTNLGVDQFIDYKNERFENLVKDVDVVFDTVGNDTQERSFAVLKKGGCLVSIVQSPSPTKAKESDVKALMMQMEHRGSNLKEIVDLVGNGTLQTFVDKAFPLNQARKAQEESQEGHTRGKIVLSVQDP